MEHKVIKDTRARLVELDHRDQLDFEEKAELQVPLGLQDRLDSLDPAVSLEQQVQLDLKVREDQMVHLDHKELGVIMAVQVHRVTPGVLDQLVTWATLVQLVRPVIRE